MTSTTHRTSQAVAHRFATLLGRIQPTSSAIQKADQRAGIIRRRLAKAFNVRRFIPVGSLWKGTAIYRHSDLDLLAVVSRDDARWGGGYVASSTLLGHVRDELRDRFPATSDIRRDGQAVSVVFGGGGPGVDVVPGLFDRPVDGGYPSYLVPDGDGGWLRTSPDRQKRYFDDEDASCGGKLRRVVQLTKWWAQARARAIPLLSYHLETLLAWSGVARGARAYSVVARDAFGILALREDTAINDPLGISGRIPAAKTDAQRGDLARAVAYAWGHARAAVAAEEDGDLVEAVRQWRIVFESFPP